MDANGANGMYSGEPSPNRLVGGGAIAPVVELGVVLVAAVVAAASVPVIERAARRLLRVRDRVWAYARLALSWLASVLLLVGAAFLFGIRDLSPFVALSLLFHYALFGLANPREAVFVETRRENRWGVDSIYPYYLSRDAVGANRVFAKWALSALLVWAVLAVVAFLTLTSLFGGPT